MFNFLGHNFWTIAIILNYILVISALTTVIFKRINPTKTLSYIIVLLVFPFFGLIIYYLFGQEYRKDKLFNRKNVLNNSIVKRVNEEITLDKKKLDDLEHNYLDEKIKLVKLLQRNEKSPLTLCNKLEILKNGEVKFKRLFEDFRNAKKNIHVEYYILKDDKIGTEFIDVLCEKAKEGLSVKLTFDDVGSKISKAARKKLKAAGVEFYEFMPVIFPKFAGKMNYRNHRKIAVIDGEIAYLGGINVSDTYVNYPHNKAYWRDTHLRLVGESVYTIQLHFLTTWNFVSGKDVKIEKNYFHQCDLDEGIPVQIAASGPDTDWANIMEAIFFSIVTAEKYVYITTPYFIPNDQIITAMQVAAKSGVDVRLLIPDISDSWTAQHATNSYLEQLFEANIKIYRYTKGFIHAKTMVVDDIFTTIGTSNMDYRSFNINFEINALIYNEEKAKEAKQIFLDDLKDAKNITFEQWTNRPKIERLKEAYCRLWAPLL